MNKFITDINEKEITQKIIDHFNDKYKIKRSTAPLSSYNTVIINLKYDFKLYVTVHITQYRCIENNTPMLCLKFMVDRNIYAIECNYSEGNPIYLKHIENIVDQLMRQIQLYEEFIQGFIDYIEENAFCDYQINLNTAAAYFKLNFTNNMAVIYPVLEFDHDEDYATMYVNSLTGRYPMKMFSPISYDDAKEMLGFFL